MPKRKVECSKLHCSEPPASGGLCQRHHEEYLKKQAREATGLELLNKSVVDGQILTAGPLRDELRRVQHWWSQVCSAETSNRQHKVLKDESRYAVDWCIELGSLIVEEERAIRNSYPGDISSYQYRRDQLWERFANLERGLMSNGVERPKAR